MQVQITNAGVALLQSNEGPVTLTVAKLGSGVNYTPEPTDTDIHGLMVFQTSPTSPAVVSANVYRYSVIVDLSAPTFDFGEMGLYAQDGTLFALCVSTALIHKLQMSGGSFGNTVRLDVYLSIVGQNYDMWMDTAESNNQFRMAVIGSVDQLPLPQNATPNAYVVQGLSQYQSAFLAYTDRNGLWSFDAYAYANQASGVVAAADNQSVTIPVSQFVATMNPNYFGEVILQFTSGALYGVCRYVKTAVTAGGNVTLGFNTQMLLTPQVGDTFVTFKRQDASEDTVIPPATTSALGGVIVGPSLTVDINGLLNVGPITFPVTSVNNKTGAVVLTATDITGFATVATTGSYNDLINKPTPYTLPVASLTTLGGVKAPPSGNLTISGAGVIDIGFTPVTSVNGHTGVVNLVPSDITGLATVATTGSYNDLLNKPTIPSAYTLPVATTTVLGGVKQGSGVTIAGDGTLSVSSSYVLPVATSSVLGGVKQGANVTIAGDGTISVAAPPVTSVSGQSGAVVVKAQDNNTASGTTLISDSGATTGTIKLKTIVAGANITLAADTNGNLQISGSAGYTLPVATATVLGGVKQGANITIAGDGTISASASYTLPVATNTVLGGVKQGTGVTIDGTGVISAAVTSVSGQTGAVVVQASDNNAASGTSLISNSGSATGNIKLKTIVAGSNITLSADSNGNLQIASTAAGGVTTFNTRAGAVTLTSADITTASGALLSDVAAAKYYDVSGGAAGAIISGQLLCLQPVVRQITFPANFAGSVGYAGTAPTASFTITVAANGTTIGTIVFGVGSQSATFTTTGGTQQVVTAGQRITMTAPGTADATIANVAATLLGVAT